MSDMTTCTTCGTAYDEADTQVVERHTVPVIEKRCCRQCHRKPTCYTCLDYTYCLCATH